MGITRLAHLIHALHISVTELAKGIHVDPSLVSRWKNGSRNLSPRSGHFDHIISYIMLQDQRTAFSNIKVFLSEHFPGEDLSSEDEISLALAKWLAGRMSPVTASIMRSSVDTNVGELIIYRGEKEKKHAFLNFLDFALSIPPKKEVYIMLGEDVNQQLDKNRAFYNTWLQKLFDVINHGHNIYLIHNYTMNSFIGNVKNFFTVCSSGQYQAFYLPQDGKASISFNMCILEDTIGMTDFCSAPKDRKPLLFSFTNNLVISQLETQYKLLLSSCRPLTNMSVLQNSSVLWQFIQNRTQMEGLLYLYDEGPLTFPVPEAVMREILEDNGFSGDVTAPLLEAVSGHHISPFHVQKKGRERDGIKEHRYIIDYQALVSAMARDELLYPVFVVSEQPIYVKRKFYKHFLESMLKEIRGSNSQVKMALIQDDEDHDRGGIMFASKENLYVYACPYSTAVKRHDTLLYTNPHIISDAFSYLHRLWNTLPHECKDPTVIKLQLESLLDEI